MGIIGLGSIGSRIAELGAAMGMNVSYWSKNSWDKRHQYLELDQLVKQSDYIFPALVNNQHTADSLDKNRLSKVKKGSFLVSITGDDLFDLEYALELVRIGKLAGLAFESDKYQSSNLKFNDFEGNVLVTPPIAWLTKEAFEEDMRIWIESVLSCVNKNPINVAN